MGNLERCHSEHDAVSVGDGASFGQPWDGKEELKQIQLFQQDEGTAQTSNKAQEWLKNRFQ